MRALLSLLALFLLIAPPARAQSELSTSEDVVIAFFKTGGHPPNYTTMAKGSPQYRNIPPARLDEFIAKESQRLKQEYAKYNPQTDLISIRARVMVELHREILEDKSIHHSMTIFFGKDDSLFFPYAVGDYHIAVVPKKMDSSFKQNIEQNQYALIENALGSTRGTVPLYIQLKPAKAYLDEPLMMSGEEQWALLADVAGLILTDSKGGRLWTYAPDWYVSPMTKELRGIYSEKTEEKHRIMEEENPLKPME